MKKAFLSFAEDLLHQPFRVTQSRSLLPVADDAHTPAFPDAVFPGGEKPSFLGTPDPRAVQHELDSIEHSRRHGFPTPHEL